MVITRKMHSYCKHYYSLGFSIDEIAKFIHKIFDVPMTASKRIATWCICCEQTNKGYCPIDERELIR